MSAVPIDGTVASGSEFNLPGYGNVRIEYTNPAPPGSVGDPHTHLKTPSAQNGSVSNGGNSYAWTTLDQLGIVHHDNLCGTTATYTLTFTFLNGPIAAGEVALAVSGIGRLDQSCSPRMSQVTINQSTTPDFLGDWDLGSNGAPTGSTGSPGSLTLFNSTPQPGAGFFNTDMGLVRINDAISSVTLNVISISDDGIGFTLGRISPEPVSVDQPMNPGGGWLLAAWPNPTTGAAEVVCGIASAGNMDVDIFSIDGRKVRSLSRGAYTAGLHRFRWDGCDRHGTHVPQGIYLIRLRTAEGIATRRLVVTR